MNKYIVTTYNNEGLRLYLKDLSIMEFTKSIINSIIFGSINEAEDALQDRFISLSNSVSKYASGGVYISQLNSDGDIIGKEERFI